VSLGSQQGIILLEGRGVIGRCLCTFRASLDKYSVAISDLCFERSCLRLRERWGVAPLTGDSPPGSDLSGGRFFTGQP